MIVIARGDLTEVHGAEPTGEAVGGGPARDRVESAVGWIGAQRPLEPPARATTGAPAAGSKLTVDGQGALPGRIDVLVPVRRIDLGRGWHPTGRHERGGGADI